MKIDARKLPGLLRDPGACRLVLVYGEDAGLVRERADAIVRAVAGALDDPFRITELSREDAGTLADEAASLSLMGGRRVVRLRDATDSVASAAAAALARAAPGLVVLEAGSLAARSKLRVLAEASPDAAAIACYPDEERSLAETIRATLAAHGVKADAGAMAYLTARLGADRALTRQELEKLALFAGEAGTIGAAEAEACVGDLAGLSLEDALFAATEGNVAQADRALELALAEGATSVGVIRAAALHLQRLHRVRLEMERSGVPASDAARLVRPPVFFRRLPSFSAALERWSARALAAALAGLAEAERGCKRTGAPDLVLCRAAVLTLARRARAAQG